MAKLTIAQFVEQINDYGFSSYIAESDIITSTTADDSGIVCEEDETVLCNGEHIYNFMHAGDDFDGEVTVDNVAKYIEAMRGME